MLDAETMFKACEEHSKQPRDQDASLTPKVCLNTLCMHTAGRRLRKGETTYTVVPSRRGFVATVQVHALPETWALQQWAGKVCGSKGSPGSRRSWMTSVLAVTCE